MTTEQKLRFLEITGSISETIKKLLELTNELPESEMKHFVSASENLLDAASKINKGVQQ
jgi:hypothetical protein